jgi:hypothetical protein
VFAEVVVDFLPAVERDRRVDRRKQVHDILERAYGVGVVGTVQFVELVVLVHALSR